MAEARLNVVINVSQRGQGVLDRLDRGFASLGRTAARVAVGGLAVAGTALAGVAVGATALGAKLVGLGSDAQEMQGKFDVVFGNMAGPVTQQLGDFAEAVGRSRFDLMGFASTIQDTLVPLGFARSAAADMSVEVTKLAVDLGSFNNIPTEQAIEDIQSALVGNTETLRKYGVVASQAAIEQFALTEGLWDGKGAMDAQTKAAAIMGIIMDGTADAQGDAARTSTSFANQMRGLTSSIKDTATEIGLGLLPVVQPLLQILSDLAGRVMDWLLEKFAVLQPIINKVGDAFERLAAGNLAGFWTRLGEAIVGVLDILGFSTGDIEAFNGLWEDLRDIILDGDKTFFDKLGESIGAVIGFISENEGAQQTFLKIWETIGQVISKQITPWEGIQTILAEFVPQDTIDKMNKLIDWANDLIGGEGSGLRGVNTETGNFIKFSEPLKTFFGELRQGFIDTIDDLDQFRRNMINLGLLWTTFTTELKRDWDLVVANFSAGVTAIDLLGQALGDSIKQAFDFIGLVFVTWWEFIRDNSIVPLLNALNNIIATIQRVWDMVAQPLNIPNPFSGPGGGLTSPPPNVTTQGTGSTTVNNFNLTVNGGGAGNVGAEFDAMQATLTA